jgi:hypothetical protein
MRREPGAGAHALFVERVSVSLNPRPGLMGDQRLIDEFTDAGLVEVLDGFHARLAATGVSRAPAHQTPQAQLHQTRHHRMVVRARGEQLPRLEEFYVAAPAVVEDNARNGFEATRSQAVDAVPIF